MSRHRGTWDKFSPSSRDDSPRNLPLSILFHFCKRVKSLSPPRQLAITRLGLVLESLRKGLDDTGWSRRRGSC